MGEHLTPTGDVTEGAINDAVNDGDVEWLAHALRVWTAHVVRQSDIIAELRAVLTRARAILTEEVSALHIEDARKRLATACDVNADYLLVALADVLSTDEPGEGGDAAAERDAARAEAETLEKALWLACDAAFGDTETAVAHYRQMAEMSDG